MSVRKNRSFLLSVIAFFTLALAQPLASFATANINVDYVEKSVVFLYAADAAGNATAPLGTGFIVQVPLTSQPGRFYDLLVTARHMVDPRWAGCTGGPTKIFLRLNKKNFDPAKDATGTEDLDLAGPISVETTWIVSPDPNVDVAMRVLNGPVLDKYDVQGVRINDFPTPDEVKKIKAGDDIVSAGLLPGASGKKRNYPIFKFGNVSSIPEELADVHTCGDSPQTRFLTLWFVAANLVPGNSGSPIYFAPGLFRAGRPFLLGVQSSSLLGWDVAGMTPVENVYDMIEHLKLPDADLRRNVPPPTAKDAAKPGN